MPSISAIEWDIIESRVQRCMERYGTADVSSAFLHLILEHFFPNRNLDFPEMVVDGGNDLGVDAIEVIERDERAEVYIFQAKHRTTLKSTDRTINDSEVLKIATFLRAVFDKEPRLLETGNLQLSEAVSRIWSLHQKGTICEYRIVFCTNGMGLSSSAEGIISSSLKSLYATQYEVYGPKEILRDIGAREREAESGYLQVIGREAYERSDGDIRGVIASVDARSFVSLIQTDDARTIKRHLFDENLRIFLGANGGYNSNIIETAASSDSHLFWYLNNGITITCRDYAYNKGHVNPKIQLTDFQIVNGAQTSHSLLKAFKKSPESFENVVILVRIYATNREDIAERVAVATNSQARIQSRDLRANDPVLKKLEISFRDRGYYFERKRNMHSDRDPRRRIDALKLGQILLSFQVREPDKAKTDSDSIFGERFHQIFHERHEIDTLCRLIELYRIIEDMRDTYKIKSIKSLDYTEGNQYLVYGHWFVLYVASLIISQKSIQIPDNDGDLRILVTEALELLARACATVKSTAQYQLFRSAKTKARIIAEIEGRQLSLFEI
ncbi:AIPR family protein [Martelella radicis]|uniref:Abortive phage infection protein C-terminal domain-containing protein n=1 Tax=Martelella radicis TaxID=1397476 RepID=A0A7W6KFR4_9HYPH|nr:AIPR family protein [Martelella radicis]MBB4120391.1 hypothetical protein [Martelella radicis]